MKHWEIYWRQSSTTQSIISKWALKLSQSTSDHTNTHGIRVVCNYEGMCNILYDHKNLVMSLLRIDILKHPWLPKWREKSMREKPSSTLCVFFVLYVFASVSWDPDGQAKFWALLNLVKTFPTLSPWYLAINPPSAKSIYRQSSHKALDSPIFYLVCSH